MRNNKIQSLVVGNSKAGKSTFILSLIDKNQADMLQANGDGQCTRCNCEYNINVAETKLSLNVKLLSKDDFISRRMETDEVRKDLTNEDVFIDFFYEDCLENEAFFNIKEFDNFDKESDEKFSDKWKKLFMELFIKDEICIKDAESENKEGEKKKLVMKRSGFDRIKIKLNSEKELDKAKNNEEESEYININEALGLFLGSLFDECKITYKTIFNSQEINIETNKEHIPLLLKVVEPNSEYCRSFTGIIENVIINVNINNTYSEVFNKLGISTFQLIDTYGLNHEGTQDGSVLKNRFTTLFKEYENIQSAIFIASAEDIESNKNVPNDFLKQIPIMLQSKLTIVPYLMITKLDKAKDLKIVKEDDYLLDTDNKSIQVLCKKINKELLRNENTAEYISARLSAFKDYMSAFVSFYGVEEVKLEDEEKYKEMNCYYFSRLMDAIYYERHIPRAGYIALKGNDVDTYNLKWLIKVCIDNFVEYCKPVNFNFEGVGPTTKSYTKNSFKDEKLGYNSKIYSVLYSERIGLGINNFKGIKNKVEEVIESEKLKASYSIIFNTYEMMRKCPKTGESFCDIIRPECKDYACIQQGLVFDMKADIEKVKRIPFSGPYDTPIWEILNGGYNFNGSQLDNFKEALEINVKKIVPKYIREYNARVCADEIDKLAGDGCFCNSEEVFNRYFKNFDSELVGDTDEMVKFKKLAQYQTVAIKKE